MASRSCLSAWRSEARASASGDSPQEKTRSSSRVWGRGFQQQKRQQRKRFGSRLGGQEAGPRHRTTRVARGSVSSERSVKGGGRLVVGVMEAPTYARFTEGQWAIHAGFTEAARD